MGSFRSALASSSSIAGEPDEERPTVRMLLELALGLSASATWTFPKR